MTDTEDRLRRLLAIDTTERLQKLDDRALAEFLVNSDLYGQADADTEALLSELMTRLFRAAGPSCPDWNEPHPHVPAFDPEDCAICGEKWGHKLHTRREWLAADRSAAYQGINRRVEKMGLGVDRNESDGSD